MRLVRYARRSLQDPAEALSALFALLRKRLRRRRRRMTAYREGRSALRLALKEQAPRIRAGTWRQSRWDVALHEAADIPAHLGHTFEMSDPPHEWPSLGVAGRGSTEHGATVIVVTSERNLLLIDTKEEHVTRVLVRAPITAQAHALRSAYGRHVRIPRAEVSQDGRILTEPFIRGAALRPLSEERRIEVVSELLEAHANLAEVEAFGRLDEQFEFLAARLDGPSLPAAVGGLDALRSVIGRGPLVPSHGNLKAQNIVVCDDGAVVIDITPHTLALRPFWFDVMTLILSTAPGAFRRGAFDAALDALWTRCGRDPVRPSQHKDPLTFGFAAWWQRPMRLGQEDPLSRLTDLPQRAVVAYERYLNAA